MKRSLCDSASPSPSTQSVPYQSGVSHQLGKVPGGSRCCSSRLFVMTGLRDVKEQCVNVSPTDPGFELQCFKVGLIFASYELKSDINIVYVPTGTLKHQ